MIYKKFLTSAYYCVQNEFKNQIKTLYLKVYIMHRSTPPPHNASFSEDSSSYSIVNWLSAHKNILLWVFFALIIFLIIFSRFLNWKTLNAEQDFFQAQAIFTQFQQATDLSNKDSTSKNDFGQLEALMQRHPELKPKYEGAIAQTLLIETTA